MMVDFISRLIADIIVCLIFYVIYHKFFIKYCKKQWIEEISQKVAEQLKGQKNDN